MFAVDEGILQVAHYKLGDPLNFFFRKRMLDVQTSQILDLILPDFKKLMALAAPGGDNGDAIGRQLNPFKRRRDKPVVYWSGIVDVNGEKDLQYAVPDYFHGKLRVMAVAVSPDLIGVFEGATTVRGDFVLSPDAPTTLAPGDEAEVGVGVSNNLTGMGDKPMPVTVQLKTGPQLQVLGSNTQQLSLAPMHEGVATFRIRATQVLGSGSLEFTASYGGKVRASAHRSVGAPGVGLSHADRYRTRRPEQHGVGGRTAQDVRRVQLANRGHFDHAGRAVGGAVELAGELRQLLQRTDRQHGDAAARGLEMGLGPALPALPAAGQDEDGQFSCQPDRCAALAPERRGWIWCLGRNTRCRSLHLGLCDALPAGGARPRRQTFRRDAIDSGNRYLQQLAGDDSMSSLDQLRQRAYAVYLLTRQGNVTTNNLAAVQKRLQDAYPKVWKNDLAAGWLAASYKLLKQDRQADELISGLQRKLERNADEAYTYSYYYDPPTRDVTVLYLLARHFPERARALSPRVLENIARPLEMNEFNTLSAAMTLLALDTYATANAGAIDKLKIEEVHADGSSKTISTLQNVLQAGNWSGGGHAAALCQREPAGGLVHGRPGGL